VLTSYNDTWKAAPQECCPIFKFNYFVGTPAGQRSPAHTKIAKVTNCSKRRLDVC
jgi:hypothetical protein